MERVKVELPYDNGARFKRTLGEAFGHSQRHVISPTPKEERDYIRVMQRASLICMVAAVLLLTVVNSVKAFQ